MKSTSILVALAAGAAAADTGTSSADPCYADATNTFHASLNPHASEWGYYKFSECGDTVMPVLAMERGVTYTFDQSHGSNWYHPLGFAYFPDGAHEGVDELEPTISQSGSACVDDNTCQAPMYYKNGAYLGPGGYDNSVTPISGGDGDFGLDFYEPEFFLPRADWLAEGAYTVDLTITDDVYEGDLFYFCHIHKKMSGRIKVTSGGANVNAMDTPELYAHYERDDHDETCGTVGLADYSDACDDLFVCDEGASSAQRDFGACLQAMDCHMNYHMRTVLHDAGPLATFIHQMIPHHQNAVNMAKALLATGALDSRRRRQLEEEEEETDEDVLTDIVVSIINVQNHQIQAMEGIYAGLVGDDREAARCSGDDAAWHKKGAPSKDCDWVAHFLPIRCAVKGADGTTAQESCAGTCDGQEESSDSSED
jgi:hypothetical protein